MLIEPNIKSRLDVDYREGKDGKDGIPEPTDDEYTIDEWNELVLPEDMIEFLAKAPIDIHKEIQYGRKMKEEGRTPWYDVCDRVQWMQRQYDRVWALYQKMLQQVEMLPF